MGRQFSFWAFVVAVFVMGCFFFWIVWPYVFPLLIAAVLAILFRPVYLQAAEALRGHERIAAVLTAALVLLVVVLPVVVGSFFAAQELIGFAQDLAEQRPTAEAAQLQTDVEQLGGRLTAEQLTQLQAGVAEGRRPSDVLSNLSDSETAQLLRRMETEYSLEQIQQELALARLPEPMPGEQLPWFRRVLGAVGQYLPITDFTALSESSMSLAQNVLTQVYSRATALLANVIQFVIGFAVMALALYYFFADGPSILRRLQLLVPLDDDDEQAVYEEFERVCRGVLLGTVLAAFGQALLLGLALAVIGVERVWLFTGLTVLFALIPFLGAAGVYVPIAGYLAWNGQYLLAAGLLAYGVLVVSTSDNLVRAYVIHGSSGLHPLVALVSVLGALPLVGIWGIFVGPIVAGIFYAMLNLLQKKVRRMDERPREEPPANPPAMLPTPQSIVPRVDSLPAPPPTAAPS